MDWTIRFSAKAQGGKRGKRAHKSAKATYRVTLRSGLAAENMRIFHVQYTPEDQRGGSRGPLPWIPWPVYPPLKISFLAKRLRKVQAKGLIDL